MSPRRRAPAPPAGPLAAMYEAHVAHEVARWSQGWAASLRDEVESLLAWCEEVRVGDVVTPEAAAAAAREAVLALPPTDGVVELLTDALLAAHAWAADDGTVLRDLVDRGDYDAVVDVAAAMTGVKAAVIEEVTTSDVYAQLIAHVLYTGIKDYLLTQNVVARRVPGASSLLRLGQSAVGAAAPGLEKGIDRQLTSFVAGNVADSIRESRDYLESSLDDRLVHDLADELWQRGSDRTVADAAALVDPDVIPDAVAAAVALLDGLRGSESFLTTVAEVAADAAQRQADRPLGDLLAAAGIDVDVAMAVLEPLLSPVVEAAVAGGHVEARIRARLLPFYASDAAAEALAAAASD